MAQLVWLTEAQMARLRQLLAHKPRGVPRVDDRGVILGIVLMLLSVGRWVVAPGVYGPRKTLYNRGFAGPVQGLAPDVPGVGGRMGLLIEDRCGGDVSGEASPNSVGELRQRFAYFAERTINGWRDGRFADYIRHKSQLDKEIHEEWIAILALLRHLDVPNDTSLRLGGRRERWDAKIGDSLFIEVSRAAPDDDHKFRQMMADGGFRTIADMGRHALSQQKVCDIVIKRINAKLEKEYPQGTILVISVSGDATNEDDDVVESWLPRIRKSVSLGGFSSIYLIEEARRKAFQIL